MAATGSKLRERTEKDILCKAVLGFKTIAKTSNVALRWRAELLLVIATKVRRILVAYAEPGTRGIHVFA